MDRKHFLDSQLWLLRLSKEALDELQTDFKFHSLLTNAYCCFQIDKRIVYLSTGTIVVWHTDLRLLQGCDLFFFSPRSIIIPRLNAIATWSANSRRQRSGKKRHCTSYVSTRVVLYIRWRILYCQSHSYLQYKCSSNLNEWGGATLCLSRWLHETLSSKLYGLQGNLRTWFPFPSYIIFLLFLFGPHVTFW